MMPNRLKQPVFLYYSKQMKTFLLAGLLYLSGIATILLIKPTLMFREDGSWKEFGIGKNTEQYTWCPFWLYCIFLALLCYVLAIIIIRLWTSSDKSKRGPQFVDYRPEYVEERIEPEVSEQVRKPRIRRGSTLPDGYYVLAKPVKSGESPSYVYLGPQAP
jgi:hypothetical protein